MYSPPPLEQFPTIEEMVVETHRTVAGLDASVRRLAVLLRRHAVAGSRRLAGEQRSQMAVPNVLLIGPTGSGKTHMVRALLEASRLPYAEQNATQYSETGYAGRDLSSLFLDFLEPPWAEGKDNRRALVPIVEQLGVVVLDEFDKWRAPIADGPRDRHTGRALQAELLRIVEGDVLQARRNDSEQRGRTFRTHHMLYIAVGAFEGLDPIVCHRLGHAADHAWTYAEPQDVVRYGFMEELISRLPALMALPALDVAHVRRILDEHVLPAWVQAFADDGIDLVFDESGVVALSSDLSRLGARDYSRVLEQITSVSAGAARRGDRIVVDAVAVAHQHAELVRSAA